MIQAVGNSLLPAGSNLTAPVPERTDVPPAAAAARAPSAPSQATNQSAAHAAQAPGLPGSALEKALEEVNDSLKAWSTGMRFTMDEKAQRMVVSIVDTETGRVLRTIPSDAVLQVARMIVKLQGASVDTQA
ncbi:Flagellar protein FlaG OS=Castellaniella defragrans OX=75697 GN=HNR28_000393 PE=4 SV=1 [Castellaniella defragrans]